MLEDTIITEVEVDKRLNIMADWIKDGDQMELRFRGLRKLRFIQKWLENIERVVTADHTTTKLDKLAEWIKEMNVTGGLRDLERIHIIKKEQSVISWKKKMRPKNKKKLTRLMPDCIFFRKIFC